MTSKQKRVPGIMGGMGPAATRDLYNEIIKHTPAANDQEHLEVLIHSYPHIDRTAAILEDAPSPLPTLIASAEKLKNAGADFLAAPCNTVHYFLPDVANAVGIQMLNMIEETSDVLKERGIKKVGLLSTSATLKTKLYQKLVTIPLVVPSDRGVEKEMEVIYGKEGVKAGVEFERSPKNQNLLREVIKELTDQGAEAIILGCTELPLCLTPNDVDIPLVNPTEVLAKAVIREAYLSS